MQTSSRQTNKYQEGGRSASFYDTLLGIFKKGGNLEGSKDRYPKGAGKTKAYPMVKSKDFAGGSRSYPIPTRGDAVDALRLAGMHGRSDVKSKVYRKYPDLKKEKGGALARGREYKIGKFNYGHITSPMSNPEIPMKNPVSEDRDLDRKSRETGARNMSFKKRCRGGLLYKCGGGKMKGK